jgi:tRNA (mo5U34)-methyltransferase
MNRDEILRKIDALGPWFHCIDLGDGIKTKTISVTGEEADHPLGTWEKIRHCLPEDLSGKSVLDVGCNAGFYAIEAKRRGATRVLGVDAQRRLINQARFGCGVLGLDIEYRKMSVYELSVCDLGQFDVTLALGLIYHCKHLVLALEKLFEVTKELLIIETAILPLAKTPESFSDPVAGPSVMLHPLAYVENPPDRKESIFNWFVPGTKCLEALLKGVGFSEVDFFDILPGGRAVVVCRKGETPPERVVLSQLAARLAIEAGPSTVSRDSEIQFRLVVTNTGAFGWKGKGPEADGRIVLLGAHLLTVDEEELIWDYGRAALQKTLGPGESETITIGLRAPEGSGTYVVEFDMVMEHVTWFEELGASTLKHRFVVK